MGDGEGRKIWTVGNDRTAHFVRMAGKGPDGALPLFIGGGDRLAVRGCNLK